MLYPKFIIQNDKLILGKVEFHWELKEDESPVNGGGWFNVKNQKMTFWKDSHDFGKASPTAIQTCIDNKQVYYNGYNISNDFHFLIQ